MDYILDNWDTIALIVTGIISFLAHTAPHTKWEFDDKAKAWIEPVWKALNIIAGNYKNAKNANSVKPNDVQK